MPMLYGEGAKAFMRLQEEIIKTCTDHSIFAWQVHSDQAQAGTLLARSPSDFLGLDDVVLWGKPPFFEMTNRGLRIELPLLGPLGGKEHMTFYAILGCRRESNIVETFALQLGKRARSEEYFVGYSAIKGFPHHLSSQGRLHWDPRVVLIDRRRMTDAVMSSLLIPRHSRMESNDPFFLVNIDTEAENSAADLEIIDVFPEARWSARNVVVHAPFGTSVRRGIALQARSGVVTCVAFGYDQLAGAKGKLRMVPAVWSEGSNDDLSLSDWCYAQGDCNHANCLESCPAMSDNATWQYASPGAAPRIEVSSNIWTEHSMGEDVFNVSIATRTLFELDATSVTIQLDAIDTEMRPDSPRGLEEDLMNVTNAWLLQRLGRYFAQEPSLELSGLSRNPPVSDLSLLFGEAMPLLITARYKGCAQSTFPLDIIDWFPHGQHRSHAEYQILEANESVCAGFKFRSLYGVTFTLVVYGAYGPSAPSGVLLRENRNEQSLVSIVTDIERCENGEALCGYAQHDREVQDGSGDSELG